MNLYRSSTIVIGNTVLHKPIFYRFVSIPSTINNSTYELFKHYIGMKSDFKFKKGSLISLQFKHLFSNNYIGLVIKYREVLSDLEMTVMQENMKNIIYEDKCMYQFGENDNIGQLNGFYKDKNISFHIIGNSKDMILKLKDEICETVK